MTYIYFNSYIKSGESYFYLLQFLRTGTYFHTYINTEDYLFIIYTGFYISTHILIGRPYFLFVFFNHILIWRFLFFNFYENVYFYLLLIREVYFFFCNLYFSLHYCSYIYKQTYFVVISTQVLPLKLIIILYNEIIIFSHGFMGTSKLFKGIIFLTYKIYLLQV
jgi:hypothetical protein